jgi:hypothetical protein
LVLQEGLACEAFFLACIRRIAHAAPLVAAAVSVASRLRQPNPRAVELAVLDGNVVSTSREAAAVIDQLMETLAIAKVRGFACVDTRLWVARARSATRNGRELQH